MDYFSSTLCLCFPWVSFLFVLIFVILQVLSVVWWSLFFCLYLKVKNWKVSREFWTLYGRVPNLDTATVLETRRQGSLALWWGSTNVSLPEHIAQNIGQGKEKNGWWEKIDDSRHRYLLHLRPDPDIRWAVTASKAHPVHNSTIISQSLYHRLYTARCLKTPPLQGTWKIIGHLLQLSRQC